MYKEFYGFKDFPFGLAPDPRYFFPSPKHQEALDCLRYAVEQRKGFCVVTGPVGSGKTTLCRTFMQHLESDTQVALVNHTRLTGKQLIVNILKDFGIDHSENKSKTSLLSLLNDFLIENFARGINVILLVDEAQSLSDSVLEEVRLISNLESDREKLIQIILLGQPELQAKLCQYRLRQLRQRIALHIRLSAFTLSQTDEYIRHRLQCAGANGKVEITKSAIELIHKESGGLPRLINLLGDAVLLTGFATRKSVIDRSLVDEIVKDPQHNFSLQPDRDQRTGEAVLNA